MDKRKTEVVKSKSISTSEAKNNTQRHHKKSRSNAEFKPLALKKRGVYVEKKPVHISNRERSPDSDLAKPASPCLRPIPRPGRKRFVASVLSILSKSTAGTQCPDGNDNLDKYEKTTHKIKKKKHEEVIQEVSVTPVRRKHRHRTKAPNIFDDEPKPLFPPPVVVLQSTKEITHTPSNYSVICNNDKDSVSTFVDRKALIWTDALQQQVINNLEIAVPENTSINIIENVKDPSTIITDEPIKDDKNIYNFFVDLLKTTFSVYNVKTEYKQPPPSSRTSSKVELEIDESVAKKLNIETIELPKDSCDCEAARKPSSDFYYNIRPDDRLQWDDDQLVEHFQPKLSRKSRDESPVKKKRKIKSDSFHYKKATKNDLFNIPSPTTNKKKSKKVPKKDLKRDFLNSLKQQLQMRSEELEEPQNFFEALKVIAKNKKRCQKSISVKESKKPSEGDVHVCQFKRRRVLSAKSSSKQSHNQDNRYNYYTHPSSSKRRPPIRIAENSDSERDRSGHSLRVFGYDYEPTKELTVEKYDDSDFILPTLSTPPIVAQDYENYM